MSILFFVMFIYVVLPAENEHGFKISGINLSELDYEFFLSNIRNFRFSSIEVAKKTFEYFDNELKFNRFDSCKTFLVVTCSYWSKCPYRVFIRKDDNKSYQNYFKVVVYTDHDHSAERASQFNDIDLSSPLGKLLYKKRKIELEMKNLEAITTRNKKRKRSIQKQLSEKRSSIKKVDEKIRGITPHLMAYQDVESLIEPYSFDRMKQYLASRELLPGLVVIARGMWFNELKAKSLLMDDQTYSTRVNVLPKCVVSNSQLTWNICPHDCSTMEMREKMIQAYYKAIHSYDYLRDEYERNDDSESLQGREENQTLNHRYNTRRNSRVDYRALHNGVCEDDVLFKLDKLPFDDEFSYPIYLKLYYCFYDLYFVRYPKLPKVYYLYSRNLLSNLHSLNSTPVFQPSVLIKRLDKRAGRTAIRSVVNKLSFNNIPNEYALTAILKLSLLLG